MEITAETVLASSLSMCLLACPAILGFDSCWKCFSGAMSRRWSDKFGDGVPGVLAPVLAMTQRFSMATYAPNRERSEQQLLTPSVFAQGGRRILAADPKNADRPYDKHDISGTWSRNGSPGGYGGGGTNRKRSR